MSEQDFYLVNGNQYRGSRYSNFAGAGIDPQGNVSSAPTENATNLNKGTSVDPEQANIQQGTSSVASSIRPSPVQPTSLGRQGANAVIGGATGIAGTTVGGLVGANLASGNSAFTGLGSAVQNRVSSGLLGTGSGYATSTNAALGSMGGKFGPATQASVSKAVGGNAVGSAVGSGIGSALSTLIAGGSAKQAAGSGLGSAAGFYLGNMILPGVGGFIGSTLGSLVGGKLFGGDQKRTTLGINLSPDESGKLKTSFAGSKGSDAATANKYADNISQILNTFGDAVGIKYKNLISSETNIGSKDVGTFMGRTRLSTTGGDAGAVALNVLKDRNYYDVNADGGFSDFWDKAVQDAKSIQELGTSVDNYNASRNLTRTVSPDYLKRNALANRRYGDRAIGFAG